MPERIANILKVESSICEAFQSAEVSCSLKETNIFGRPVLYSDSADISWLSGVAVTGVRAGAELSGMELSTNYNNLSTAARQHLAMVIHVSNCLHAQYHMASAAGCFQLFASNSKEEIDFTLIARRIAELSLVPGLCASDVSNPVEIDNVDSKIIRKFLGDPDDHIKSPTPSQELIFGSRRQILPNWLNLNLPSLYGMQKRGQSEGFEFAAKQEYFYTHLPALVSQAFREFNELTGNSYSSISSHETNNAEYIILTQGESFHGVCKVVDILRSKGKKVACINLSLFRPFPEVELLQVLKGKKAVTVLENISGSHSGTMPIYQEILSALYNSKGNTQIISGLHFDILKEEEIHSVFNNMWDEKKQKFYLGLDFARESSRFPKHEILQNNIKHGYPNIQRNSITVATKSSDETGRLSLELPYTVRHYKDNGPAYTRLSRFYDDIGLFHQKGVTEELVADPFQAIPGVPAASASFGDFVNSRKQVPVFNAKNCTGCGDCFVYCPHSAIPPISIGMESLIRAGATISGKNGTPANNITPVVKNLAKVTAKAVDENRDDYNTAGEFLRIGFDKLVEQTGLSGDKLKGIQTDFETILNEVSEFPVAITDTFFDQQDAQERGSGEFFSLAIDPGACTGCGVCANVCKDDALSMEEQSLELVSEMQSTFKLWESLPDTSGDTIKKLHHNREYNSFASILLSRNFYMSMTGGTRSELCGPSKQMLHLITALTESLVQPRISQHSNKISGYISDLNKNIHSKLVEGLPVDDFDVLYKAIEKSKGTKTPFDELIKEMGHSELMKQIDTHVIKRKTELLEDLKNLHWLLNEGPTGTGRSRYSMVINGKGSFSWVNEFPFNVFTSPVIINWNSGSAESVMGIFHGQLRYLLDNIKILRRAGLEIKDKYDPDEHGAAIANLKWSDLTEEEKELVPPIILLSDTAAISEQNRQGLNHLLASDYPVKVVILDQAVISPDLEGLMKIKENSTSVLSAIALKNAYVLQGGLGDSTHLFNGLHEGIQRSGPALFNLYVTDMNSHSVLPDAWPKLSSLAHSSRAVPSIKYNPDKNTFFGSSIVMDMNPSPDQVWHSEKVKYELEGEAKLIEYHITWADWAHTSKFWKSHFQEIKEDVGIPVKDYLELDEKSRAEKIPVIIRLKKGVLHRYRVSEEVIMASELIAGVWNTWREIAGTITEFPDKLKKQITEDLSSKYEKDLLNAKAEFKIQLQEMQQLQNEVIRVKLRNKLAALARQKKT